MFSSLKHMPSSIYIVLFGSLATRTIYFMLWPFMAIIFYQKFDLSIIMTGTILGIATLLSITFSVYSGNLSDKIGRRPILITGLLIVFFSFIPLIFLQSFPFYLVLSVGVSIGKGLIETVFKAIISDGIQDAEIKKQAFYWQYFCINIGGAVGPLLGVSFTLYFPRITFTVLAIIYLIYLVICFRAFNQERKKLSGDHYSLIRSLSIIKKDSSFMLLIIAYIIIILVFGQLDSTLAQYFSRENIPALVNLFSYLIAINCTVVVLFQFPFLKFVSKFSDNVQVYLGIILLAIAQIIFSLTPTLFYLGWIAGIIVLSFGEIILFSVVNVQIDKLAPDNLKGAYFGASSMYMLGLVLAPYIGGVLLQLSGRTMLYSVMTLMCFVIFVAYKWAMTHHDRHLRAPST